MKILLVGSPNVGKTTLFNYLTKKNRKVSNFSGTTVSFASGSFYIGKKKFDLVDTPGLYSLYNKHPSITDNMVKNLLLQEDYDLIINIITEDNLHNNLLLTTNILDLGVPTIVIVNITNGNKENIDTNKLESSLGCKVLKLKLNSLEGLDKPYKLAFLSQKIIQKYLPAKQLTNKINPHEVSRNANSFNNVNLLLKEIPLNKNYVPAPKIFYGSQIESKLQNANSHKERFEIIFNARTNYNLFQKVTKFVERTTSISINKKENNRKSLTDILDMVFLNKILGLPIFLLIMYFFFFVVINVSKVFQDFFESIASIFLVTIPTSIFNYYGLDNFFSSLALSIGSALVVIITFIPILFIFHICLDFLENSGYMSRGAYLTDSIMRLFGLPGKSLITMLVGFGCNVPAILSTRTVSNKVERVLTIVAAPFISCSARLTVYVLFTAVFFPKYGVTIVYLLYLSGIVVGVFTVWFFKNTLFKNKESYFILELPKYRFPQITSVVKGACLKLYSFIFHRVSKIIIPVVIVFFILNYVIANSNNLKSSFIIKGLYNAQVILSPMGITKDNWEATISLIGGTIAKEIVVTTLQSLYLIGQQEDIDGTKIHNKETLKNDLNEAINSLKEEFINLYKKLSFKIEMENEYYSNNLANIMEEKFKGIYGAIAYLLFTVIYTPCLITLGAVRKELNSKWMHFTNIWSILIAYIFSSAAFQILTFQSHKVFSLFWLAGCILFFAIAYKILPKLKFNY